MTLEGGQVWEVLRHADGQVRTLGRGVIGLDAGAVLALASAAGCEPVLTAYVLPDLEALITRLFNKELQGHG